MGAQGEPAPRSLAEHRRIAGERVDRAIASAENRYWDGANIPEVRQLTSAPPDEQRSIVITLIDRAASTPGGRLAGIFGIPHSHSRIFAIGNCLGAFGSRRPPFTREDTALLLHLAARAISRPGHHEGWGLTRLAGQPVRAAEQAVRAGGVGELRAPIRELAEALGTFKSYDLTEAAKQRLRLLALLQAGPTAADDARPPLEPSIVDTGDTWGVTWRAKLDSLTSGQRSLFVQCSLSSGVVPSAAWRKKTAELAKTPGAGGLLRDMLADAPTSASMKLARHMTIGDQTIAIPYPAVTDGNATILRGAMWAAAALDEPWVVESLTALGLHFGTSGGSSNEARDARLGNTAAAALGAKATPAAIAGLGRLKAKVTNRNVSKQIAKALESAATQAGITSSELLEVAISREGLDERGVREIAIGGGAAVLALEGDEVSLTWRAPDGRVTARPPVAFDAEKAAVARAKSAAKELRASLAVERGRVEDLLTEDREWSIDDWRARYLEHPLTGSIGRRLVWRVRRDGADVATVIALEGGAVTADGRAFDLGAGDRIRLWHPIDAAEADVAAWRALLMDRRIRQPFKQAFREVYRLAPAEEETATYSNRFAAHILRYPQARALMTARRWGSNFLGPYDGGYNGIAKRDFPAHALRAEFWHDAIEDELENWGAGPEHCATDQVRFLRPGGRGRPEEVVPLVDVPAVVFSETMRDVDLFVSVTSIGADRNWQDGGPGGVNRFGRYWGTYQDAPLTATSEVRRDALARMLPGLAIADRLELLDRWLRVRGDLRTYRIHLGSGNILMEPNDAYLCIVPARGGASDQVFLPFDDDPTLSVILSKAFLLARDARIKDPTITRQIQRG